MKGFAVFLSGMCILIVFTFSYKPLDVQRMGLLTWHHYFSSKGQGSLFEIADIDGRIWFKDSFCIFERKTKCSDHGNFLDSTDDKTFYAVYKYTFMDLRTLICQDYIHLSDTCRPVANYRLKENEYFNIALFSKKNNPGISDSVQHLSDTIMHGKSYKRIIYATHQGKSTNNFIYLYACDGVKNIFNLHPDFEGVHPDCELVRSEFYSSASPGVVQITELTMERNSLTDTELSIFNRWLINSRENKLPLLTYKDSRKTDLLLIQRLYDVGEK